MVKTVRDVMMPEPWTIDARTSLEDAAHYMRAWDLREVLVTHHGQLCGALSDRDIIVLAIASGHPPSQLSAGSCSNPDVPRLGANQPADEALDYMRNHELRHVPVVDGHRLVGTAWITDLDVATADQSGRLTNV